MSNTSGSEENPRKQTKTRCNPSEYVGIDLHKKIPAS